MKNTALICLLAVTLAFTSFAAGFFLGRNINHSDIQHSHTPAVTTSAGEKMNINTATVAQLQSLPGIGQVLAKRIVDYRQENGLFTTTEQLLLVEGIGESLLDSISDQITVGG